MTSTAATLNVITQRLNKMRSKSSALNPTDNIYEVNVPMIKDYLRDMREMQLDQELQGQGKVNKNSVYGAGFVDWGG